MSVFVHPTSVVEAGARLDDDVYIGPFCVVKSGAIIGKGTYIYSGAYIDSFAIIGENNKIFHGATIGTPPQDLKYKGEETFAELGDNNIIREFVTINRGTEASGKTKVGNNCLVMAYAHIAHDCRIGNNVIIANAVNMGGHVEIDDFAIIGGVVAIHQFVRIGAYAIIGGGLRITQDVCPYIMVGGPPAMPYGLNIVGLRRHNFSPEKRELLKKAYDIIFRSSLTTSEAKKELENNFPQTEEIKTIIRFIERSERGLLKLQRKISRGE